MNEQTTSTIARKAVSERAAIWLWLSIAAALLAVAGSIIALAADSIYAGLTPSFLPQALAQDVANLMDHLSIARADVMGYSLGARIGTILTISQPERVRSLILGGIGQYLVQEAGLPGGLAEAMEAERIEDVENSMLKIFRGFAESTRSDLRALAACVRGARKAIDPALLAKIECPVLICVGTRDDVAGDPSPLEPLFRDVRLVDIPGRDHNRAVGDRVYKQAVLEFLATRP